MPRKTKERYGSAPNMKKPPRSKKFTGCWTCKRRRVKCDETKPSCQRCDRLRVTCEGYEIRLNWVQSDGQDNSTGSDLRLSRRSLPCNNGTRGVVELSSVEIDETLETIDAWLPEKSPGLARLGFSVFSAALPQAHTPIPPVIGGSIDDKPSIEVYQTPQSITVCGDQINPTRESSTGTNFQPTELVSSATLPLGNVFTEEPPGQALSSFQLTDTQEPVHFAETEEPSDQNAQAQPKPPRHLDELFMPRNQKRLIHHWVTFTSRKLVLLDEPHNPCRTLMLPMALVGLTSRSAESNSNVGIFHALCACAAYNLYELGGRAGEDDLSLALAHDQQAIHHLRHNLARADEHRDASFAMLIMACVAVEAVSGTTQRWRTHVSGGLAYLARLHSRGDVDEAVLAPFRRHMVLMAILCDFSVAEDLKAFLDVDSPEDGLTQQQQQPGESLEVSFPYYGVSRTFLRAHDRMNVLAVTEGGASEEINRQLDAFELQLYLAFPSPPLQHQGGGGDRQQLHTAVIQHASTSYYYAGLVYFQRSIRRAPVASVQDLVELGVAELEAIDQLGRKEGELGCMMLWPVLVLGAECDRPAVQQRIRAWFQGQKKLGFRNLVVLEDLITHVWQLRSAGNNSDVQEKATDVDWREIIALPRFDVFRL
ncbi:fungal-specific transcription factor domain-containing protein [Apiospora marii]|uniref:Fungal-specific transcription factor domain-containing protein n=1 Tax=Apiospora marii TaxID=335849 RepID=A0ABR1R1P8_9PEZI